MENIEICVFDKCNNRCLMCTNPSEGSWPAWDGSFDYGIKSLKERVLKLKKEQKIKKGEIKSIYLSGGEPTIHPDFIDFFVFLKEQFSTATIKLLTNGRRFLYQDFSKKVLVVNDNIEIIFSICGPNAKIHDGVTRTPGSFIQMVAGLNNVLRYRKVSQRIGLRFVISRVTVDHIHKTLKFITSNFPALDEIAVVFMEIEGHGEKNLKFLKVGYDDVKIKKELEKSIVLAQKNKNIFLYHFPLCTVPQLFWPFVSRTLPKEETTFLKKCKKCKVRNFCLGIPNYYLENKKIIENEISCPDLSGTKIIESFNYYTPIKEVIKNN